MNMITIRNLCIRSENRDLLHDVSLDVAAGAKIVITGPSGCGKSSLLRALVGLQPFTGSITVNGLDLVPEHLAQIRAQLAFITQDSIMGAELARDALLLPFTFRANQRRTPSAERVAEVLGQVRLAPEVLERPAGNLSGGERQRIAIARCLLLERRIFLADEITSALDADTRDDIIRLFLRLPDTILAVAHDEVFIRAFPVVYRIEDGQLRREE